MIVEINLTNYICSRASPTQPAPVESPRVGTARVDGRSGVM